MSLDLYDQTQILNILASIHVAGDSTTRHALDVLAEMAVETGDQERHLEIYRAGYRAALGAVALAFGLRPACALPWKARR